MRGQSLPEGLEAVYPLARENFLGEGAGIFRVDVDGAQNQ